MQKILLTSILAITAVALLAPGARAALAYNSEDIVVAFSNNATPNHTGNTYLVDLGSAADFKTGGLYATGDLVNINSGTAAQFLTDFTAAGLNGGANRRWSLQGANDTILDLFLSKAEPAAGIGSTAFTNGSAANPNTDILTMVYSFGTSAAASGAPNSFIQNTNDGNSYGKYVFGALSTTQAYDAYADPEAPLSGVLDLYQITDGTGAATRLGAFDFNAATGLVRFSSDISDFAPVPEPTTLGFGLLSLVAGGFRRTRRAPATA